MQTAQGIFKLWSGSHQSRRNIPKADVEGWTRRATRSQQRHPRGVLTASHFLICPSPSSLKTRTPLPLGRGWCKSLRRRVVGDGGWTNCACRAGLLCKALLAQEVDGPSIRCYSTTGIHASQIPRVQGGGLLPWTVPPAHAVQLDVRPANRGPGGSGCCSTSSSMASPGGGLRAGHHHRSDLDDAGAGNYRPLAHVATAYFKVVKYLFAHTIQGGDPRARPTRCVVCPVRPVLYSTCTINARCEMRHSRHRQQGRSSMANPRGRACGLETNK